MDWLEMDALLLVGSVVETVVVYLVTGIAGLFIARSLFKAFAPPNRTDDRHPRASLQPPESDSPCGSCTRCGFGRSAGDS